MFLLSLSPLTGNKKNKKPIRLSMGMGFSEMGNGTNPGLTEENRSGSEGDQITHQTCDADGTSSGAESRQDGKLPVAPDPRPSPSAEGTSVSLPLLQTDAHSMGSSLKKPENPNPFSALRIRGDGTNWKKLAREEAKLGGCNPFGATKSGSISSTPEVLKGIPVVFTADKKSVGIGAKKKTGKMGKSLKSLGVSRGNEVFLPLGSKRKGSPDCGTRTADKLARRVDADCVVGEPASPVEVKRPHEISSAASTHSSSLFVSSMVDSDSNSLIAKAAPLESEGRRTQ